MVFRFRAFWRAARMPVAAGVCLSAYAGVRFFSGGGVDGDDDLTPVVAIIAAYMVSAIAVGLVVYLFGWWATSRSKGAVLGGLAAVPLAVVVNYTLFPMALGEALRVRELLVFALIMSVFPGAFVGALYWEPGQHEPDADNR